MMGLSAGLEPLPRIVRGVENVAWLFGAICMVGWYVNWLGVHFLWRYVADVLGVLTIPLIPIAVLIEWLWHGWPTEVMWWLILASAGMILSGLAGRITTRSVIKSNQ